ncbi:MAG TPA: hypothetical protein VF163_02470 [Micromonosporaceae bacterium]
MPRPARLAVRAHRHNPAPDEPATHDGRQVCRDCAKPGKAGDAQHPDTADWLRPFPEVPAEVAELEARRLGELGAA